MRLKKQRELSKFVLNSNFVKQNKVNILNFYFLLNI